MQWTQCNIIFLFQSGASNKPKTVEMIKNINILLVVNNKGNHWFSEALLELVNVKYVPPTQNLATRFMSM